MREEVLLKDIRFEKYEVHTWKFIEYNNYRVYYQLSRFGEGSGFYFYVAENIGGACEYDEWDIEATEIRCVYNGVAMFDGIRHLYMGCEQTDNYGYIFYPRLRDHIALLQILRDLEVQYCREPSDEYDRREAIDEILADLDKNNDQQ